MKNILVLAASLAITALLCGCNSLSTNASPQPAKEKVMPIQTTYQFLKDAGHYFIASVDGDQPRVRPFGTIHIFEGKLYIQTGRSKNVGKQLAANGKVEICAMKGEQWIRVCGTLVDDQRVEAKASMLDEYPSLKAMYSAEDENTMVLYFKPQSVTATIYSFKDAPVVMSF